MPPAVYVLDTNVLVHLIRGDATGLAINKDFALSTNIHSHVVSIVTHGELHTLANWRAWGPAKRAKLQTLLDDLVTIDIDEGLVNAYSEIDVASRKNPHGAIELGKNDLWIAATAKVFDATVLTTDADFDHLDQALVKHVRWLAPGKTKP